MRKRKVCAVYSRLRLSTSMATMFATAAPAAHTRAVKPSSSFNGLRKSLSSVAVTTVNVASPFAWWPPASTALATAAVQSRASAGTRADDVTVGPFAAGSG